MKTREKTKSKKLLILLLCLCICGCEFAINPGAGNPGTGSPGPGNPGAGNPGPGNPVTTDPAVAEKQNEITALVNTERSKAGLAGLSANNALMEAAMIRAKELASSFSHTRPDGKICFTVLAEKGIHYSAAGENIAAGYTTSQAVMNGWMNSEGHRNNILNKNFTRLGVGYYVQNGYAYWVQLFTDGN